MWSKLLFCVLPLGAWLMIAAGTGCKQNVTLSNTPPPVFRVTVVPAAAAVTQGQTGVAVVVEVFNYGPRDASIGAATLDFAGAAADFAVIRTDSVTAIPAFTSADLTFEFDVAVGAAAQLVTIDAAFTAADADSGANASRDWADQPASIMVQSPAVLAATVQPASTDWTRGQSGLVVVVEVANSGEEAASIASAMLDTGAVGANLTVSRTDSVGTIAGGSTAQLVFSVDVAMAAPAGNIDLEAVISAVGVNTQADASPVAPTPATVTIFDLPSIGGPQAIEWATPTADGFAVAAAIGNPLDMQLTASHPIAGRSVTVTVAVGGGTLDPASAGFATAFPLSVTGPTPLTVDITGIAAEVSTVEFAVAVTDPNGVVGETYRLLVSIVPRGPSVLATVFSHDPVPNVDGKLFFNHTPSVAQLADGTLIAVWFGGREEGRIDGMVVASRSTDGGSTWAPPTIIDDPPGTANARDPLVFVHQGKPWILYRVSANVGSGASGPAMDGYLVNSTDGGLSWGAPALIDVPLPRHFTPLQKPRVLPSGELLFAAYWRFVGFPQPHAGVLIASADLSVWEVRGDIAIPVYDHIEPNVIVQSDQTWRMYFRTDYETIYTSTSTDQGFNWTAPAPLNVPQSGLFNVAPMANGRVLVVWAGFGREVVNIGIFDSYTLDTILYWQPITAANKGWAVGYPQIDLIQQETEVVIVFSSIFYGSSPRPGDIFFARCALAALPRYDGNLPAPTGVLPGRPIVAEIEFDGADAGWAVGPWGRIFATADGGSTWLEQTSNTGNHLSSVAVLDANTVVAVGSNVIATTTDGGTTWTSASAPGNAGLLAVAFRGATGIAVGSGGIIVRSIDSGATWSQVFVAPVGINLRHVAFASSSDVWAVGDYGRIFRSVDGGQNWAEHAIPGLGSNLRGIVFDAAGNGAIVGQTGVIVVTANAGTNWTVVPSPINEQLNGVTITAVGTIVAVSNQGAVLTASVTTPTLWTVERADRMTYFMRVTSKGNDAWIAGWGGTVFPITR